MKKIWVRNNRKTQSFVVLIVLCFLLIPYFPFYTVAPRLADVKAFSEIFNYSSVKLLINSATLAISTSLLSTFIASLLFFSYLSLNSSFSKKVLLCVNLFLLFIPAILHYSVWHSGLSYYFESAIIKTSIVLSISYTPLAFIMLVMSLSSYDKMSIISGRLYGTSCSLLKHIIIPHMLKPLSAAILIIFAITLGQSEIPSLFSYSVYATEISARAIIDEDIVNTLIVSLPILLPSLILGIFGSVISLPKKIDFSSCGNSLHVNIGITKISRLFLGSIIGLIILFITIFWAKKTVGACCSFPLTKNLNTIFQTIIITGKSSTIALFISFFSADLIIKLGRKYIRFVICFCIIIYVIPSLITGIGIMSLKMGIIGNIIGHNNFWLILSYTIKITPVFMLVFLSLNASDDIKLNSVYESRFINWFSIQRFIRIPIFSLRLLFLLLVGISFLCSELTMTILLVAPGTETLILRSYNLMHYGAWNEVILISVCFAITILLLLIAMSYKVRWGAHD